MNQDARGSRAPLPRGQQDEDTTAVLEELSEKIRRHHQDTYLVCRGSSPWWGECESAQATKVLRQESLSVKSSTPRQDAVSRTYDTGINLRTG